MVPNPTDRGFAAFTVSMAQTAEDVKRAATQFLGKVFTLFWSDQAEGVVIDPIPNPKRYLCFGVTLGFIRFIGSLDFGTPGWYSQRVHDSKGAQPPPA